MSLAAFALVASPLLAFLAVLLGHRTTRRGAQELDRWRKREETMRLLRWGAEIAMADDPRRSTVGLRILDARVLSPLLDDDDTALVRAVTRAVAQLGGTLNREGGRPP